MGYPRNRGAILLEAWRAELGLTQLKAAVQIGLDPSPYSKFESGTSKPGLKVRQRIKLGTRSDTTDGIPVEAWDEEQGSGPEVSAA